MTPCGLISLCMALVLLAPPVTPSLTLHVCSRCSTTAILRDTDTGEVKCGAQCVPTMCGVFQVPQEHLKVRV